MNRIIVLALIAMTLQALNGQPPDVAGLNEKYKAYDAARNDGKGHSDNASSATLGWGEGGIIHSYAKMWEVTKDTHWLAKIRDHFSRIMSNASDPDGDGFKSWQTKRYSCAVASAERLCNVSEAKVRPQRQKNRSGKQAAECTGHTYIIQFPDGPDNLEIIDYNTRKAVAEDIEYTDGLKITDIRPFEFTISGKAHQGDRFMVRTIAPEPIEFTVHQGMFIYPVAKFIEAVKTDAQLEDEFGADADRFLQFINTHVFEKNERDWLDMGAPGGAYRFEPKITDRHPNRIMPHNQYGALARAWLVLAEIDGAHPLMAKRARQMVTYFHNHLKIDRENNAYRWHYWDWTEYGETGHSGWEDTSHGHIDVSLAVEAARRGVVFNEQQDMHRLCNTWLKVMFNGDEDNPKIAHRVAGDDNYRHSALYHSWTELAQWDRTIYELALTAFENMSEKARTRSAPTMLLCAKRAGVKLQ